MPEFKTVPRSSLLEPPTPLRIAMDESKLHELADSIREYGLILPIAVTASGDKWEIIDGHRRFCACGIIGMESVPIAIFDDVDDAKFGMMLHANIMREDVTAVEEGTQFIQLSNEKGWSIEQLMRFFGRSENYINERAQLVQDFPDVSEKVATRELAWSQAKAIMRCKEPQRRAYLIDQAIACGVNARNISVMVDDFKRQDRLAMNIGQAAAAGEVYVMPEIQVPVCIWCQRDDDQGNMTLVSVHTYHRRDLEELLERVANMPGARADSGDGGSDVRRD